MRLAETWDIAIFLLLMPLVIHMGAQLAGDWENHGDAVLPGTATVTVAEPFRSGTHILVDVSDEAGQVVAQGEEVNGEAPPVLGATFPVRYLPPDGQGAPRCMPPGMTRSW